MAEVLLNVGGERAQAGVSHEGAKYSSSSGRQNKPTCELSQSPCSWSLPRHTRARLGFCSTRYRRRNHAYVRHCSVPPPPSLSQECLVYSDDEQTDIYYCADTCDPSPCDEGEICSFEDLTCEGPDWACWAKATCTDGCEGKCNPDYFNVRSLFFAASGAARQQCTLSSFAYPHRNRRQAFWGSADTHGCASFGHEQTQKWQGCHAGTSISLWPLTLTQGYSAKY